MNHKLNYRMYKINNHTYNSLISRCFSIILFCSCFFLTSLNTYAQDNVDTVRTKKQFEVIPLNTTIQAVGGMSPKVMNGFGGVQTLVSSSPTTLGATIGGAKDIGYIRNLINNGLVPKFIDFSAEGLYSEHDIPSPSTNCTDRLCLSLGYGYAPTADNNSNALFIHLGFASGIKPEDFKRPALMLALAIDRSGSMNEPANSKSKVSKLDAMKLAIKSLLTKLNNDDFISIVTFENVAETILPLTQATTANKLKIEQVLDELKADGGTNIEAGLKTAYSQLTGDKYKVNSNVYNKRVMLFTDAQPNIGATDSASFCGIIEKYSQEEIGITAFGVGLDFGHELAYKISNIRGGNYFFLESTEKITKVFDTEFDYLVTPVVYDLKVNIKTPDGMKLIAVYGLPTWKAGDKDANLEIPTVFFSNNRGAIVLRYEKDNSSAFAIKRDAEIATGQIFYTQPDGKKYNSEVVIKNQSKGTLSPGTQFYTHQGMKKAVALTNIYFGLKEACLLNTEGKQQEALNIIKRAKTLAMVDNLYLNDAGLKSEINMLEKLANNIQTGNKFFQKENNPNK